MGLRKQNSWLKYAKLRTYKTKVVWPPQSNNTTTWSTQSTTTFFQFPRTCTCQRLNQIVKRTHETYTTNRRIFLLLWTGDRPNYNQNPQHIGDSTICTDRKHWPGCKTLSQLLCHTSWCQNTIFASNMILQFHPDASYINGTKARSTASGNHFLGNNIKSERPIVLNSAIHTLCKIVGVAASAAEAELGSLFLNMQETLKLRIDLQ